MKSEFRKHDITDAQYPSQVQVSDEIQLEVLSRLYAQPLFDLTVKNAAYLSKWLAWPRSVVELGDSLNFIENAEKGFFLRESANYAVFYRGALCGVVGFNEVDKCNQAATIGYWIGKEYQGLGVARAAVARLIEVYRREYAIKRFVIKCAIFNERSNRLALALGFEHEGVLRRAELLNGVAQDQNVYGLIEGE